MLLSKASCDEGENSPLGNPLLSTFSMISLAEMGDKTQLSAITLSAKYDSPYLVFLGAVLALASISLLGILVGRKLCEIVPLSRLNWVQVLCLYFSGYCLWLVSENRK